MDTITNEKYAKLLCEYSLEVKKDDLVIISSTEMAMPLMKEIYKKCLLMGAHPKIDLEINGLDQIENQYGNNEHFKYVSPYYKAFVENANKFIKINCPYNTWQQSGFDLSKNDIRTKAHSDLRKMLNKRQKEGKYHWCVSAYPCDSGAQNAKMSLNQYEEFIKKAMFLHLDSPQEGWIKQIEEEKKYISFLKDKKIIKLKGKNADLTFSIEGRSWVHSDAKWNNPDGEIFTAPIEDSINGWIRYDYVSTLFGQKVENMTFEFENGYVKNASADSGISAVRRMLELDEGMKRVGEFAIATNYNIDRFIDNGLFDEKRGGTIHIANGDTLDGTGGKNTAPVHWDNITTFLDGEIAADGIVFYKNGKFII